MEKRYNELIEIINKANIEYYTMDNPSLTDQEYDRYMQELLKIEEKYPEMIKEDSPSRRVGGKVIDSFKKVTHEIPMLSLSNVFNESEIIAFDEKVRKEVKNPVYVAELKIDGLSVSLLYKEGKLVRAATRGDGVVGEDITHNAVTIKTIPLSLNEKVDIEVRGEIYMSKKSFEEIKEVLEARYNTSSAYIIPEDLKYLKRGGRVTPTAAAIYPLRASSSYTTSIPRPPRTYEGRTITG